jgi:hypothetical protein
LPISLSSPEELFALTVKELTAANKNIITAIDDLIAFCNLLAQPENHIKVATGQYVERPSHIRQVHDMSDEMAQGLTKLPRYQAYTKLIDESQGNQVVRTHQIQTHPLPEITNNNMVDQAIANAHQAGKKREEIEAEIRERQNRGGRGGSAPQTRAPR